MDALSKAIAARSLHDLHVAVVTGVSNLTDTDKLGQTALHLAAQLIPHQLEIVQFLVLGRSDLNAKDGRGRTPLHQACRVHSLETVNYLLEKGADPTIRDGFGATPALTVFAQTDNMSAERVLSILESLHLYKCDVNSPNKYGTRVSHRAAELGISAVLTFLHDIDADLNKTDHRGRSPLHFASASGQLGAVKCLLSCYADREVKDVSGRRPVDVAELDGVKYLLNNYKPGGTGIPNVPALPVCLDRQVHQMGKELCLIS